MFCGVLLESWRENTHVPSFELVKFPNGKGKAPLYLHLSGARARRRQPELISLLSCWFVLSQRGLLRSERVGNAGFPPKILILLDFFGFFPC